MNEADTRAELIDPKLRASGWGIVEGTKIFRNHKITDGRIQPGGRRENPLEADYILTYKGYKLAVVEAKRVGLSEGEGVAQAKNYADMLQLDTCFSSNGKEIYQMCMKTGKEGLITNFPTPEELWNKTFPSQNLWRDAFADVPFENKGGTRKARYYQEIAVNNVMKAIGEGKQRILLTLATGTGKTFIAFQIAWKLFQTRWNLKRDGSRIMKETGGVFWSISHRLYN
jgi:type I restriction enzyme R subunit